MELGAAAAAATAIARQSAKTGLCASAPRTGFIKMPLTIFDRDRTGSCLTFVSESTGLEGRALYARSYKEELRYTKVSFCPCMSRWCWLYNVVNH